MKQRIRAFSLAGMLIFLVSCAGGAGGGSSSDTRALTGNVSGESPPALKAQTSDDCAADTVIATDASGNTTTASVNEACDFTMDLQIGQSHVISFSSDGTFVATLIFDSGVGGFTSSDFKIGTGSGAIDLGLVTIRGKLATPEKEPKEQTDEDDDGVNDLEDDDDDNDGVEDELESEDCDLDGVEEGDDEGEDCEEEDTARVLEVKPRNDPHPELGEDRVDLDKEVKARISCEVDQDTVTSETFRVASDSDTVACSFDFSGSGHSGNRIECEHEADFLPDTVYTVTIDGVRCLDGREVTPRSWRWLTEEEDDDDGDIEDELDEEDEMEDENDDDDDSDDDDDDDEDEDD